MSSERSPVSASELVRLTERVVKATPPAPLRRRARRFVESNVLSGQADHYEESGLVPLDNLIEHRLDPDSQPVGFDTVIKAGLRLVNVDVDRYADLEARRAAQRPLGERESQVRDALQGVARALEAGDAAATRELAEALTGFAPDEPRAWAALARVQRAVGEIEAADQAEARAVALMAEEIASADPPLSLRERMRRFALVTFLGGPAAQFVEMGQMQLNVMLEQGLEPHHRVLDIGCGTLRAGLWLMKILESGRYLGIEPNRARLGFGIDHVVGPELMERKQPRFDGNAEFDLGVFDERFDFMVARSVWTHASKTQILAMLDGFVEHGAPGAVFLTSFIPARTPEEDYTGEGWVGRSESSPFGGLVGHDPAWIQGVCQARGLSVVALQDYVANRQIWLRIERVR